MKSIEQSIENEYITFLTFSTFFHRHLIDYQNIFLVSWISNFRDDIRGNLATIRQND